MSILIAAALGLLGIFYLSIKSLDAIEKLDFRDPFDIEEDE